MSDERLRVLERRWKESGAAEDEFAYLHEQVRTGGTLDWGSYQQLARLDTAAATGYLLVRVERGDLERERLELAAHCGHLAARLAVPHTDCPACDRRGVIPGASVDDGPIPCRWRPNFQDWLSGLRRRGPGATLRALLAAVDHARQMGVEPTVLAVSAGSLQVAVQSPNTRGSALVPCRGEPTLTVWSGDLNELTQSMCLIAQAWTSQTAVRTAASVALVRWALL